MPQIIVADSINKLRKNDYQESCGGRNMLIVQFQSNRLAAIKKLFSVLAISIFLLFFVGNHDAVSESNDYEKRSGISSPLVTEFKCGNNYIEVWSFCSNHDSISCSKQIMKFRKGGKNNGKFRDVQLNPEVISATPATEMVCGVGRGRYYVKIAYCQVGDCYILMDQRFEIRDMNGVAVVPIGKDMSKFDKKTSVVFDDLKIVNINLK